jgi:vacuolar protein sorting-associated protein 13A/C
MSENRQLDCITAELGEIYANNTFVPLEEEQKDSPAVNMITAGIRNIRLSSDLHYDDGSHEQLEMIQKVNLDFSICYLEHQPNQPRPDIEVEGTMSPIKLRVCQPQVKFLLEISKAVPGIFAQDSYQQELEAMQSLPSLQAQPQEEQNTDVKQTQKLPDQGSQNDAEKETWVKLDMIFKVESVGLELILAKENKPVGQVEDSSLSRFSLNNTRVKMRMLSDGALESELLIHSFSIRDSRAQETNKFRKIMSLINNDVQQQFMASISMSPGPKKHLIAMITIDSPRIILALDYLMALQSFASEAFAQDQTLELVEETDESLVLQRVDISLLKITRQGLFRRKGK